MSLDSGRNCGTAQSRLLSGHVVAAVWAVDGLLMLMTGWWRVQCCVGVTCSAYWSAHDRRGWAAMTSGPHRPPIWAKRSLSYPESIDPAAAEPVPASPLIGLRFLFSPVSCRRAHYFVAFFATLLWLFCGFFMGLFTNLYTEIITDFNIASVRVVIFFYFFYFSSATARCLVFFKQFIHFVM